MTALLRIQRKRTAGWRMPANTVYVGRPSSCFQNRYTIGTHSNWLGRACANAADLVACYEHVILSIVEAPHMRAYARERLAGKNLACWCRLCPKHEAGKPLDVTCTDCAPCHVDPLGRIANGFACEAA